LECLDTVKRGIWISLLIGECDLEEQCENARRHGNNAETQYRHFKSGSEEIAVCTWYWIFNIDLPESESSPTHPVLPLVHSDLLQLRVV